MRSIHALCALLLSLAGCGGSSGNVQDRLMQDVPPIAAATVADNSQLLDLAVLRVGKEGGSTLRAVLRFEIPSPPPGARLERATLETTQRQVMPNTYAVLGDVIVQSIEAGPTIGPIAAGIDGATQGTLAVDDLGGPKTWDATAHVRSLLEAGATLVDLRIQFEGDVGSFTTPQFAEFDKESTPGGSCRMRFIWQLAY